MPDKIIPTAPADTIQFKLLILADGVAVHHDVGITGTALRDLLAPPNDKGEYHPDLQGAALVGIKRLVEKYNGLPEAE